MSGFLRVLVRRILAPSGADGSWSPEGVILFDGRATDPIRRVAAAGGSAVIAVLASGPWWLSEGHMRDLVEFCLAGVRHGT